MKIDQHGFGNHDGVDIKRFVCQNDQGLALELTNYGAIVLAVRIPDADGRLANITVGFDKLEDFVEQPSYFGATIGRFGNRIAAGRFQLDGEVCQLAINNGPNHLHGGIKGFNRVTWQATPVATTDTVGVAFERRSPDGEEGYPGNLDVRVEYLLTNTNRLIMAYEATTDRPTHVNLTNHCFWNLAGQGAIHDQRIEIAAARYLPIDAGLIPTGELREVAGSAMDLRTPRRIGAALEAIGDGGFDHCYVLDQTAATPGFAARVTHPPSGREMAIYTTQPGIQFYSGNFLDGGQKSAGLPRHSAFCLETQHFPDSPNQPQFPTTRLNPGERWSHRTEHHFSITR